MNIKFSISDEAAELFAEFNGYQAQLGYVAKDGSPILKDNPQSRVDFITEVLVDRIKENVQTFRENEALEQVRENPIAIKQ